MPWYPSAQPKGDPLSELLHLMFFGAWHGSALVAFGPSRAKPIRGGAEVSSMPGSEHTTCEVWQGKHTSASASVPLEVPLDASPGEHLHQGV